MVTTKESLQSQITRHLKPFVNVGCKQFQNRYCTLQNACKYKLLNDKYSQEREKHSLGDTLPWKSRMLEFL